MSLLTVDVMRRALQVCRRGLLQKHLLTPAVASSRPLPVPSPRRTTFYCGHRHFSDTQAQSRPEESTAAASKPRHFSDAQAQSSPEESTAAASKPRPEQSMAAASNPRSVFYDRLVSCHSPSDVLDLTLTFVPTPLQLSFVLDRMWNSLKKLNMELRSVELELMKTHVAWNPLMQHVMGGASLMTDRHLAYSLLALINLGVNPRTRVVQTFLREAQERINYFDDKSLSILSSALADLGEEGANVRELKYGIRLLVEDRLPRIHNVLHLQTMMMLVGKDAPLKLKRKLEARALSLSDQFTSPQAQRMFTSLADLRLRSKPLLFTCSRKITEHLPGTPFNRLISVLLACKELRFKDLQLLNAVSDYGASMVHVWNHQQFSTILSSLDALSFCPESLLDAYSELVQSEPDALTLKQLLCVLRVCSASNYHPPSLVSCLTSALEKYVQKMSPQELLSTQYNLCVTGHFSAPVLQTLLQETTIHQLTTQPDSKFVPLHLSMVALCLRLEHPDLHQTLPVSSSLLLMPPAPPAPPAPHGHSSKPHLSTALQTLMQDRGEWSVSEAELLEGLHFIDAVLTRKPGNGNLEESSVTASSQSVALLCPPAGTFCFGSSRPRGFLALKLRHLRLLGYLPLLAPEQQLLSLSEQQRVNFLQDLIFPGLSSAAAPEEPPPPGT